MSKSIERSRAVLAWDCIEKLDRAVNRDEYRSLARDLPFTIQDIGIGQALAYLLSKKDKLHHSAILDHLQQWLFNIDCPVPWNEDLPRQSRGRQLVQRLIHEPPQTWWVAESEAIEFAVWLKRFAEGWKAPDPPAPREPARG